MNDTSFVDESDAYFQRNYGGKNLRASADVHPVLERMLDATGLDLRGKTVVEVGCAAAYNLIYLERRFEGTCELIGVEPGRETVRTLSSQLPEMTFYNSGAESLPLETARADLVILRSVLHWLDRNHVLQALGEAVRVSARYILVSDFAPSQPYCNIYAHKEGLYTYKVDYRPILLSTGMLSEVYTELCSSLHPDMPFVDQAAQSRGEMDWHIVRTTLYEKRPLPIKRLEDFSGG